MHSSSLALLAVLLGLAAAGEYAPALYKYSDSHYSPFFPSHGASYRSPHYGGGHDGSYAPSYGGYGAPHFGQAHYAPSYGGYGYGHNYGGYGHPSGRSPRAGFSSRLFPSYGYEFPLY